MLKINIKILIIIVIIFLMKILKIKSSSNIIILKNNDMFINISVIFILCECYNKLIDVNRIYMVVIV